MEVSYFINNSCNLQCKHCYIGLESDSNCLSADEWQKVFIDCIALGALTFGNVGKEPTLAWKKTLKILRFFKEQRALVPRLRYGIVTNGVTLSGKKIDELAEANPTYIDMSFDGTETVHDSIRGNGMYRRTFENLSKFPEELKQRVFVSFTANYQNLRVFADMLDDLYGIGIRNFLISPYVSTEVGTNDGWKELLVGDGLLAAFAHVLRRTDNIVQWGRYENLQLYIKSDYMTSRGLMDELVKRGSIRKDQLMIDDYGVLFNQYQFGSNSLFFNYIPFDDTFIRSVRIGHDGFVSSCHAMFFNDAKYHDLAIGNVRNIPIREILHR